MWRRVNNQTSATHQTVRAKNIPYQHLLIVTHIQLTQCAACDKALTRKRQLHTKPYGEEHTISTLVDHNPYSADSMCCMWQWVNAQKSATHQTSQMKNIPYQPLLIITHIQLTQACCMWQSVNAQTSATHQTLRAKNIPYQPLLIITHIQLTQCAACDKGLTLKRQLHTKPYGRKNIPYQHLLIITHIQLIQCAACDKALTLKR